jgi:hypothetical protein
MANLVDWTPEPTGDFAPGIHLGRVAACELKRSEKSGSPYFSVRFVADDPLSETGEKTLCFDVLMLGGAGRSIGQGKLEALGFEKGDPIESPEELIGRRAWLACVKDSYKGKERLKVDISADGSVCGYWPEDAAPAGATSGLAPTEDTPW